MTKNEMLMALSKIWISLVENYPEADLGRALEHIQELQKIVFKL